VKSGTPQGVPKEVREEGVTHEQKGMMQSIAASAIPMDIISGTLASTKLSAKRARHSFRRLAESGGAASASIQGTVAILARFWTSHVDDFGMNLETLVMSKSSRTVETLSF
jgi:hypothetical protein